MTLLLASLIVGVFAIIASVAAAQWLAALRRRCPRPTWAGVAVWLLFRAYSRLVQRTQYIGVEHLPVAPDGPIIIVANHTGAADPILLQAGCPFEIRWMMMREMNRGVVLGCTRFGRIILVERDGKDFTSTREALRHLKAGGAIGIFPEGGIERPPEMLRLFHSGVGFLVARSKATVYPAWISGTPKVDVAMKSLWQRGRARVEFGAAMRFDGVRDAIEITRSIRDRLAAMSRWPWRDVDARIRVDLDSASSSATEVPIA